MPDVNNWNDKVIADFRANGGRVGGNFEARPSRSYTTAAARVDASTSTQ